MFEEAGGLCLDVLYEKSIFAAAEEALLVLRRESIVVVIRISFGYRVRCNRIGPGEQLNRRRDQRRVTSGLIADLTISSA